MTYTLTYANTGLGVVHDVVLTDTVPALLTQATFLASGIPVTQQPGTRFVWDIPDLEPGAVGEIVITGILSRTLFSGPVTNVATIWNLIRGGHGREQHGQCNGMDEPLPGLFARCSESQRGSIDSGTYIGWLAPAILKRPGLRPGRFNIAGGGGFEPPHTDSESAVLPLDEPPFSLRGVVYHTPRNPQRNAAPADVPSVTRP